MDLINISKTNLNLGLIIQNCFKILNIYYCSKEKYLNSDFFSNSFFYNLYSQSQKAIGKFDIIRLENINKIFKDRKNFSFVVYIDNLNFQNIERFTKYISFVILRKSTHANESEFKSFSEFVNFEDYKVLINKNYKKNLPNKKIILQKIKKRLSNIFVYKLYFVYFNFINFFKKILKNIKKPLKIW